MRSIFLTLGILCIFFSSCKKQEPQSEKPRIIITTDIGGDPDDQQSLVRLLLYANEFDIESLIASSSGTPGELGIDTVKDQLIRDYIDAYEKVLPNLREHDKEYPDASYLREIVKRGNPQRGMQFIGAGHDTEASAHIIEVIDREDSRKINICIWGGQTDLAQALYHVKSTRTSQEYLEFVEKMRVYDIADQDHLYGYIKTEFPELFYVLAKAPEGMDKREAVFRGMYLGGEESLTSGEWINENIRENHGPLCALYPDKTWTAPNPYGVMKEGDTPSWFYFLQNGLQDPDHPEWGGWGGRFRSDTASWFIDAKDFSSEDTHARATVYRWRPSFQAEFAARADRCVRSFAETNHAPVPVINGKKSNLPVILDVSSGQELKFSAIESVDPDGDELNYFWWVYPEAGSHQTCPEIDNYLSPVISLRVPEGEEDKEIHLICEISDNGTPSLVSYQRIVLRIE